MNHIINAGETYTEENIQEIIKRSAKILSMDITDEGAAVLAKASRYTPRVANRLLRRARDYMEVYGEKKINEVVAKEVLDFLDIDSLGLEAHDRAFLRAMIEKFVGGPVGIKTLAAALNEDDATLEEVYEPYLMKLGFVKRTPAGRVIGESAKEHLGIPSSKLV